MKQKGENMPLSRTTAGLITGLLPSSGSSHSQQSGGSSQQSTNSAQSTNASQSRTYGTEATQNAINAANVAWERQKELAQMQMEYNAREAQKQRDWETQMANSVYTRSVANMKEAGINPILAAGFGLSGASVGSGATASISGMSAPMANTFADQSAQSIGQSSSEGQSTGSSWNYGFSDSMYGIEATLQQGKNIIDGLISSVNSSQALKNITDTLTNHKSTTYDKTSKAVNDFGKDIINSLPEALKKGAEKIFSANNKGKNNWQRQYQTK